MDIARNDTAISSFPDVDINKDATRSDSQCSSSSSFSSESGSSSAGLCYDEAFVHSFSNSIDWIFITVVLNIWV